MGLFGGKKKCCICGSEGGKYESLDGLVCQKCFAACGRFVPMDGFSLLKSFNGRQIRNFISQNEEAIKRAKKFTPNLVIGDFAKFDDTNRLWTVNENAPGRFKIEPVVWSYDNFDTIDVIEDGNDIVQGSVGSALVGGALFGDVGAVVGSVVGKKTLKKEIKKLEINIKLKNSTIPNVKVILIQSPTKSDNPVCKKMYDIAKQIVEKFDKIGNSEAVYSSESDFSAADEILKYKNLLDMGVITSEEFETKKRQLLGL